MRQIIQNRGASTAASAADSSRETTAAVRPAPMTDPTDSPFRTRRQAETVFAHFRRGAEDESEMGAFSSLRQPQREDALRIRLEEYLRVGLEAGIFYAT